MLGNETYRNTVHALCHICIQRHSRNCFLSMTMSGIELTNLYEHDARKMKRLDYLGRQDAIDILSLGVAHLPGRLQLSQTSLCP